MLIQFHFKNFKSFRDDTYLDLSATKITEHADRVPRIGNEKLLPTAAILGANASGKSNVIDAFRYMANYVNSSFSYGGDAENKKANQQRPKLTPFLFDAASKTEVSFFEVYYIDSEENGGKTYNYGFTLDQAGVAEEWLNVKAKTAKEPRPIFYRSKTELDLSGLPQKSQENLRIALENEALLVSLGAKLKVAKLKAVWRWFNNNTNCIDFGDPFENAWLSCAVPIHFLEDKSVQKNVVDYLSAFDDSIIDFRVKVEKDGDKEKIHIDAIHRTLDGVTAVLPLDEESSGTLKMFALYPMLQDALDCGGVLLVDELNARLHPLLVRALLLMFLNPAVNPNHAQLIFTTHDAWQLSNDLLRRDEIWFTEKDSRGISSLYSLADFVDADGKRIRRDESYTKNYLLGKYGAIPTLKGFDLLREDEECQE